MKESKLPFRLILVIAFIAEISELPAASAVKIVSGKATTPTTILPSSSSLRPKFTPSQQIVTDLLTPNFVQILPGNLTLNRPSLGGKNGSKSGGVKRKKKSGSGRKGHVQDPNEIVTPAGATVWNLEHLKIPIEERSESEPFSQRKENDGTAWSGVGVGITGQSEISSGVVGVASASVPISRIESRLPYSSYNAGMSTGESSVSGGSGQGQSLVSRIGYATSDPDADEDEEEDDDDSKSEERVSKKKAKKSSKRKGKNKTKFRAETDASSSAVDTNKIQKLEELLTSLTKNVDVMRQNTQVISKGFNILSTRFNKLSSDQDELNLKLDKKFVLMEESVIRMQKEIGKKIKQIESKEKSSIDNLKKIDHDLLDSQITTSQEQRKWMDQLALKVTSLKSDFDNESKVLAEMVKALAEIQKKEKVKLDKLEKKMGLANGNSFGSKSGRISGSKNDTTLVKEDIASNAKIGEIEKNMTILENSLKSESEFFKTELTDLSKYVEDRLKRLEEQNMAHNLAHENLAAKLEDLESTKGNSGKGKDKEASASTSSFKNLPLLPQERLEKLEKKVESMEDTDLSILSRIAELRNKHSLETGWTQTELSKLSEKVNHTSDTCVGVEKKLREIAETKAQSRKTQDLELKYINPEDSENYKDSGFSSMEVGGIRFADMELTSPTSEPQTESLLRTGLFTSTPTDFLSTNILPDKSDKDDKLFDKLQDLSSRISSIETKLKEAPVQPSSGSNSNQDTSNLGEEMEKIFTALNSKSEKSFTQKLLQVNQKLGKLTENLKTLEEKFETFQTQLADDSDTETEAEAEDDSETDSKSKSDRIIQTENGKPKTDLESKLKFKKLFPKLDKNAIKLTNQDYNLLQREVQELRESLEEIQSSTQNVTKAQEFFLLKILEIESEQKLNKKITQSELSSLKNGTEDSLVEIARNEERLNKVVQQFEITDAEQAKIREELVNIKDRLAGLEEHYINLWKNHKKSSTDLEQVANSLDNLNVIHGSELRTLSTDFAGMKEKMDNSTKGLKGLSNRIQNLELLMDVDVKSEPGTSELVKLKQRLENAEKDVAELWKSSEILSFQQQVMGENFKFLESTNENHTQLASLDRSKAFTDLYELSSLVKNLTKRVISVEKISNPPYETKTINYMIRDWYATLSSGLGDAIVEYEIGSLLPAKSSWKAFLSLAENSSSLSLTNVLLSSEGPLFNELELQLLDGDGRVFTTLGPEQNLYKGPSSKFTWSNLIPLQTLENPKLSLLSRNTLRLRLKVRVYPQIETEEENLAPQSEKQLVLWEIPGLMRTLSAIPRNPSDPEFFQELSNFTKEFAAGHTMGGFSLWRASLLVKNINHQNYLGLSLELREMDGDWKKLEASYNVTLLDAYSRIVKEFAISINDFTSVSARHSYFIPVSEVESLLSSRGDLVTLKILFDLQGTRKSFEVEVINR